MTLRFRSHGDRGPVVVVLHGGPGAPGSAAGLARELGARFRVLEPMQRGSGEVPLTVARHVADLADFLDAHAPGARPALVGSSWGAMLALAFAAEHPDRAGPIALVGCGTFDAASRAEMEARLRARGAARLDALLADGLDPDAQLARAAEILFPAYTVEPVLDRPELDACDARAHEESWNDMLRLQADGTCPAAFARIATPVAMFHGAEDPHPGRAVHACLKRHLPALEYHEWPRCGHYPWLEREVAGDFLQRLGDWLARHAAA